MTSNMTFHQNWLVRSRDIIISVQIRNRFSKQEVDTQTHKSYKCLESGGLVDKNICFVFKSE